MLGGILTALFALKQPNRFGEEDMRTKNLKALSTAIATALLATSFNVSAQQESGEGEYPDILEEVLVTARKREESLQDVPFSVAAMTETAMQDRGVVTLEDVARNVASFTV